MTDLDCLPPELLASIADLIDAACDLDLAMATIQRTPWAIWPLGTALKLSEPIERIRRVLRDLDRAVPPSADLPSRSGGVAAFTPSAPGLLGRPVVESPTPMSQQERAEMKRLLGAMYPQAFISDGGEC